MTSNGLYSGFESYQILSAEEIERVLKTGILALDTNVLLNLYRYNDKTVDDILMVANAARGRLFIPHQVVREFWRNRQSVIASLGSATRDAHSVFEKNTKGIKDAISRWAKSIALSPSVESELIERVDNFYSQLREQVEEGKISISVSDPTSKDHLLRRLEALMAGAVGAPLPENDWDDAVAEGERRVENLIPPGYKDADKLESDIPEGASGDYIMWHQLILEGTERRCDLVLVTSDLKEDWWNRAARGAIIGARQELIQEYMEATGHRFVLLEPADLIKRSAAFGVGTSPESVQDIERVRDEIPERAPWTADAARAVLKELEFQGHTQAAVIHEAIANGGLVPRQRVYEIDERDEGQSLRGFTRPVKRVTAELQTTGLVPYGVPDLLDAVYGSGVKSTHFEVPTEVVELLKDQGVNIRDHGEMNA